VKNITLKIDDETYRKARMHAASEGTSISAMVRGFLNQQADVASPLWTKSIESPGHEGGPEPVRSRP